MPRGKGAGSREEVVGFREEEVGSEDEVAGSEDEVAGSEDEGAGSEDEVVGSVDEGVGSVDEVADARDEVVGSEDEEVGPKGEVADSRDEVAGSEDEVVGSDDEVADSRDEVVGSEDEEVGSKGEVADSRDEVAGSKGEVVGSKDEVVGSEDEVVGSKDEVAGSEDEEVGSEDEEPEPGGEKQDTRCLSVPPRAKNNAGIARKRTAFHATALRTRTAAPAGDERPLRSLDGAPTVPWHWTKRGDHERADDRDHRTRGGRCGARAPGSLARARRVPAAVQPPPAGAGRGHRWLQQWMREAKMKQPDIEEVPGWNEMMQKYLDKLPVEERLAGLDPEEVLGAFATEQLLVALPPNVLRLLPEEYLRSLPDAVQAQIRTRLQGAVH
jgi:hypothetical protein